MASIELKLTGANELAKKLRDMPVKVEKQILQGSVLEAMEEVLPEMIDAAPAHHGEQSDLSKKYGTIKDNMRVVKLKKVSRYEKGARIDTGRATQGFWYEYGTRYQPARPWFGPAIRGLAQKVIDVFSSKVGEGIENLWGEK